MEVQLLQIVLVFVGSPFIGFHFTANSHSVFVAPTSSGRIIMAEKKKCYSSSLLISPVFSTDWLTHSMSSRDITLDKTLFPTTTRIKRLTPTDLGQIYMSNIWAELDLLCPVQWIRGNRFKRANHKLVQACVCVCAPIWLSAYSLRCWCSWKTWLWRLRLSWRGKTRPWIFWPALRTGPLCT